MLKAPAAIMGAALALSDFDATPVRREPEKKKPSGKDRSKVKAARKQRRKGK